LIAVLTVSKARLYEIFIRNTVAIIVDAVTDLIGCRTTLPTSIQLALVYLTITIIIQAVAGLLLRFWAETNLLARNTNELSRAAVVLARAGNILIDKSVAIIIDVITDLSYLRKALVHLTVAVVVYAVTYLFDASRHTVC
jgi:hypothetical protein